MCDCMDWTEIFCGNIVTLIQKAQVVHSDLTVTSVWDINS